MKKVLSLILAGSLALSLVACGGAASSSAPAGSSAPAEGNKVLKVAAIETAYGSEMWKAVAKAFEASHEGVTVELVTDKTLRMLSAQT